ncbi:MAG: hypothetical protein LUE12_03515 [Ruminococcus sp.]|nr:hypothetical protein [Ruminococcus sp.]
MEITRKIGSRPYTIELSEEEMKNAYNEVDSQLMTAKVFQYLDSVESVGQIPSELLYSERFVDLVLAKLSIIKANYNENIAEAVSMAVDYEIKAGTMPELLASNTADIVIDKLNRVSYRLGTDCGSLSVTLKNEPHTIIKSLNQSAAVDSCNEAQKSAISACTSIVEKYKAAVDAGKAVYRKRRMHLDAEKN